MTLRSGLDAGANVNAGVYERSELKWSIRRERQEEYLRMVEYILAHDWKDKKNYSNIDFIGNPDWVKMRYFQIKAEVARRRELKKKKKPRPPNEADDNQDQPDPVLKKSKYKK